MVSPLAGKVQPSAGQRDQARHLDLLSLFSSCELSRGCPSGPDRER